MDTLSVRKKANIRQSNELTEAAYFLSLQAKRVIWLCLMQTYLSPEEDNDLIDPMFKISVSDYQKYFNVGIDTASADVKKGIQDLSTSAVTFFPKNNEYEQRLLPWLAEAGLKRGRGSWSIEFNNKILPYLCGLSNQFTSYSLYDCGKLNSLRVIRLYESLCQFKSTNVWVTTQEWLCERFMLPPSQRNNLAELKRTFLNPAIKKINDLTPIQTAFRVDSSGKLIFTIASKS